MIETIRLVYGDQDYELPVVVPLYAVRRNDDAAMPAKAESRRNISVVVVLNDLEVLLPRQRGGLDHDACEGRLQQGIGGGLHQGPHLGHGFH